MSLRLGVPKEITSGERRVALVPDVVARLVKKGFTVVVEKDAGKSAFFSDDAYRNAGAEIADNASAVYAAADIVLRVQPPSLEEIGALKGSSIVIGLMAAHANIDRVRRMQEKGLTSFSLELVPRITRAQAMDVLSSQATVAGYKAALMAANMTGRFLPMLTTAAGTIRPAKVLIMGAGVAGLQAIATMRRLGAIVEAYDVRRAAGEQVQSLGAKFLALEIDAEGSGGYARELTAEEKVREQEMLARHVGEADAVITTAQIPGRAAPRLISRAMVERMKPGSVVIDLAAESGGNCELTKAGEVVDHHGVSVVGPVNIAATLPVHASEMYAKNMMSFLGLFSDDGSALTIDWNDEIIKGSVVTREGRIMNEAVRKLAEGGSS
ncbi:MAG: NAD(P) transhydrogenase subunit alpha [Gammaproteobacteria bacterium]|nr:MAG: NAD(P) transhydrogenase subunit alpha [Gammaproteobacteria bacterium]TND05289.1 MAG: NAD(P) transhydrogenase subunit alpha [Gammaproteobacteria bacterium]